jgi:putative transcriptional regulator
MNKIQRGNILDAVHDTATGLHGAGLIDDVTMREFDVLCLPAIKKYTAREIKNIRVAQHVSQPVFAAYLNVSKSTVAQWEQGEKKPRGTSLKLLDIVERKGLDALS